ncbi:autotransporter assembly complex protein TamA [Rhodovulum sulfidophilum]|uniref:autotransporter assembly complex protein TamA n=1 Tax=Rhodovulum sulfidophilum TaxID=35806 RepID=UPI0030B97E1C
MTDTRFFPSLAVLTAVFLASGPHPAAATEAVLSAPGVSDELRQALEASALTPEAARAPDASAQDIFAAARADYARLVGVLYARGYYGPEVHVTLDGREAADLSPLSVPARIGRVEIRVAPGRPFAFSQALIEPLAPGTDLPDGFAPGKPAEAATVRAAAKAGVDGWRAAGHAKAKVAGQSLIADHPDATLAARLRLAPGPAIRFGDLVIAPGSGVREDRLRTIAGLPMGEPFDPDALDRSAERLRRTGAFRSVRLTEAETLGPGNSMDIGLEVVDQKKRRAGAGVEFSSLEGATVSGFWMHRNLMGGAERLRFDFEIAGIGGQDDGGEDLSLSARFDRPAVIDADTGLYLLGAVEDLDEPDYTETNARGGGGLTRIFSPHLKGEAGVLLRYADVSDDLGDRKMTHLTFPVSLTWDRRDDPLDAHKGFYLDGSVTPLLAVGGAAESGALIKADGRIYQQLGSRLVLAGRAQIGSVVGAASDGVPPALLFFSGGGGTVRGQPYQSLAVDLPNGDRIGGRSFIGLSGEARVGVTGAIQMVAFYDAGFVGPDSWVSDGDWQSGAGLGLRYDTGIGPIRFDVAAPVDGDTGDGVQFYIGIGQAF